MMPKCAITIRLKTRLLKVRRVIFYLYPCCIVPAPIGVRLQIGHITPGILWQYFKK